jgi:hypothetical protein
MAGFCILYIQHLPQHSSDSAVTGPVEIGPIPMRATASTGGSKPRLYCHRFTQYVVHLCRRRHSCQRGMNAIALLCLLCSFSTRYHSHVSWVSSLVYGVTLPQVVLDGFLRLLIIFVASCWIFSNISVSALVLMIKAWLQYSKCGLTSAEYNFMMTSLSLEDTVCLMDHRTYVM